MLRGQLLCTPSDLMLRGQLLCTPSDLALRGQLLCTSSDRGVKLEPLYDMYLNQYMYIQ